MSEIVRSPVEAVEAAIKAFGGAGRMAQALNVSDQAVSWWRRGERDGKPVRVPAHLCPTIERLTGGGVRCEELQPDVEWRVLRLQAFADVPAQTPTAVAFSDLPPSVRAHHAAQGGC